MASAILIVVLAATTSPEVAVGLTEIIVATIVGVFGLAGAYFARGTRPEAASDTSPTNVAIGDWAEMLEQQRQVNRTLSSELDRLRDELTDERQECSARIEQLEAQVADLHAQINPA